MTKLFGILFIIHLIIITVLVIFLVMQAILGHDHNHHFDPAKWYPPLLASTAFGAALSLVWQSFAGIRPSGALRAAFCVGPMSTSAAAVVLLAADSSASLTVGIASLLFSVTVSLYGCWVSPRFEYAARILTVSGSTPPHRKPNLLISLLVIATAIYSLFLTLGIGAARAHQRTKGVEALLVLSILSSLAWTSQVVRNTLIASNACVLRGTHASTSKAMHNVIISSMGSVCLGSILAPIIGLIWGSARVMVLVGGGADEFLFSCAGCYSGMASAMVRRVNRWGFVHIGVHKKGFFQASADVWDSLNVAGLGEIIASDLTGSFCFVSAVGVGAMSSLVSGSWALVVHKSYSLELMLYSFIIGYFLCRIAMACQQGSLQAYYVAYAENGRSSQFDSTIPDRIQELRRVQA